MMCRLAGIALALTVLAGPLTAQTNDAESDGLDGADPFERPDISWWDSDYWAEWEAERERWRSDWMDYDLRHPGRVSAELARVIRGGTPTPHRVDGGAAALAELDYGLGPGTLTRELRWLALDRDFKDRVLWADRSGRDGEPALGDLLDSRTRTAVSRRWTRQRVDRVRDWYRAVFEPADADGDRRHESRADRRKRRRRGN